MRGEGEKPPTNAYRGRQMKGGGEGMARD